MKRTAIVLTAVAILLCALSSCDMSWFGQEDTDEDMEGLVRITGVVTAVDERIYVEVDPTDFTSGPYNVIVNDDTGFVYENGTKAELDDVKVGQRVEIAFGGQVMLSYPPQIVARKVIIK